MQYTAQVPAADNYYAALNSAVFSDGSFCYVPKGVRCPMEVATYFRINAETSGQVRAMQSSICSMLLAAAAPSYSGGSVVA